MRQSWIKFGGGENVDPETTQNVVHPRPLVVLSERSWEIRARREYCRPLIGLEVAIFEDLASDGY